MKKIVIAIDGFSSCGKSTMAKELANKISYVYVDSGALYRAVTLFAIKNGLFNQDTLNKDKLLNLLTESDINLDFKYNPNIQKSETYLNSENVEKEIRTMNVSERVSTISAIAEVRHLVDKKLHDLGEKGGIVMDGRDIGTTVFPNAELKIFVTASPDIRAERRLKELHTNGETDITFEDVLTNLKTRDTIDQNRKESPLKQASDAIVLDNSFLTKEEQMQWLVDLFQSKTKQYEQN